MNAVTTNTSELIRRVLAQRVLLLAASSVILTFSPLSAQAQSAVGQSGQQASAIQRADTSSPRATLLSFIDACNQLHRLIEERHYLDLDSPATRALTMRIVDCLDTSQVPEYARSEYAGEAAVCLKEILDRVELPPDDEIPDIGDIKEAGGPEKLARWQIPGARITVARVEEGPQKHEYLFTAGTVGRAAEYYNDVKQHPYRTTGPESSPGLYRWYFSAPRHRSIGALVDRLPDWTREKKLGMTAWKWPGLLILLLAFSALMVLAYALQWKLTARLRQRNLFLYCLSIVFPIVAMLIPLAFRWAVEYYLALRGTPLYIVSFCANATALAAGTIVIVGMSNRIAEVIIASPRIQPTGLDAQLIRIVFKLASLTGIVIVLLEGGRYLGIPLTTLLAGAGVSGLAIALAAQDTLKALFGTITLMADKPFRVGERIIFAKYDGVVEEIGLRSTRLRLLTGHQATVPNDELARVDIENVGRRPHIRRVADILIPLDTPREKVEAAVEVIRSLLDDHEGMVPDFPPRVYFNGFNPSSFNIRIIYWYHPADYWDFLQFSQQLNIDICRAFEDRGIQFSLPARITYTAKDSRQEPLELRILERQGQPTST